MRKGIKDAQRDKRAHKTVRKRTLQCLQELREVHGGWRTEVKRKKEQEKGLEVSRLQWSLVHCA